ncbi:hypothetical protein MY11210_003827 [Beauveria gryllotalpidicola]
MAMNLLKRASITNDANHSANYLVNGGLGTVGISGNYDASATIVRKVWERYTQRHPGWKGGTTISEGQRCPATSDRPHEYAGPYKSSRRKLAATDGTMAMDAAIELSLLVAKTTEAPFRGSFVTFSRKPRVLRLNLQEPLRHRFGHMSRSK